MDDHRPGAGRPGPPLPGELLGPDGDPAAQLERWAAEARVDEAARQRTRERWLRQQAEEGGTLAGVLCDLAERGTPVAVRTRAGHQHRGRVQAVGEDFVAVAAGPVGPPGASGPVDPSGAVGSAGPWGAAGSVGPVAFVALAAVSAVQVEAGLAPPTGDRAPRPGARLANVLAGVAAEREQVLIVTAGHSDPIAGSLRSVGRDLVVVRLAGREPATAYVPLAAVAEVVVGG